MRRYSITLIFSLFTVLLTSNVKGQFVERVDPPNWWQGMALDTLELVISGEGLDSKVKVDASKGDLVQVHVYADGALAHVKILLEHDCHGDLGLRFGKIKVPFEIEKRESFARKRLTEADLIYLITPDRFANGTRKNDSFKALREQGTDRSEPYARHGGDLQGVQQHLDHIQSLGASAIWLNPVLENDMVRDSYHGYAITDHYRVDLRYGGNEGLKDLVKEMQKRDLKHVADVVYNHWGVHHYLHHSLADSAMIHFTQEGQIPYSNFRFSAMTDPYKSPDDSTAFQDGWFAGAMPDINQDHPLSSAYMRMATLWYVEEFSVDALRCDTYAFSSPVFLARMNKELKDCFPGIFIFGETWAYSEGSQAFFAPNTMTGVASTGNDAVTDFTLWRSIHTLYSSNESDQFSWDKGAAAIYYRLANDIFYSQPQDLVTFIDNHDDGRFLGQMAQDTAKLESALTLLYFLRGIPTLYYGTEFGLSGHENHGAIREDMPFFDGDIQDYSIKSENLLNLCQELGDLRKLWAGRTKLTQRVPKEGWLVLERHGDDGDFLLMINATSQHRKGAVPEKVLDAVFVSGDGKENWLPWEARIFTLME